MFFKKIVLKNKNLLKLTNFKVLYNLSIPKNHKINFFNYYFFDFFCYFSHKRFPLIYFFSKLLVKKSLFNNFNKIYLQFFNCFNLVILNSLNFLIYNLKLSFSKLFYIYKKKLFFIFKFSKFKLFSFISKIINFFFNKIQFYNKIIKKNRFIKNKKGKKIFFLLRNKFFLFNSSFWLYINFFKKIKYKNLFYGSFIYFRFLKKKLKIKSYLIRFLEFLIKFNFYGTLLKKKFEINFNSFRTFFNLIFNFMSFKIVYIYYLSNYLKKKIFLFSPQKRSSLKLLLSPSEKITYFKLFFFNRYFRRKTSKYKRFVLKLNKFVLVSFRKLFLFVGKPFLNFIIFYYNGKRNEILVIDSTDFNFKLSDFLKSKKIGHFHKKKEKNKDKDKVKNKMKLKSSKSFDSKKSDSKKKVNYVKVKKVKEDNLETKLVDLLLKD